MKNKKLQFLRFLLLTGFFVTLIFGFKITQAATLYFSPASGNYTVGNIFTVTALVNTENVAINNSDAVINFPANLLEVVSVSKSGSIFSLWVEEPTFSNGAGTISYNGGIATPGYNGASGKLISIVFRVKNTGSASVIFSSAAVRANDGFGTNVLKASGQANFKLVDKEQPPAVVPGEPPVTTPEEPVVANRAPAAPIVSSANHPDAEKWYANNNPEFTWDLPFGVTGVSLYFSEDPGSNPGPNSDGLMEAKDYQGIEDGVWYFHIKFRNQYGWGAITHRKVLIDTVRPEPFDIEIKEGKGTSHFQPTLLFETTDALSGIDYYEIKIDLEPAVEIRETEYQMPLQSPEKHTVIVKAVDKAGNYTLAMKEVDIQSIASPVITEYPQELLPGSTLLIKGTALPEMVVRIYVQKDKEEAILGETKSDVEGNWFHMESKPVEKGTYKIWAEIVDPSGAKSQSSDVITVLVNPSAFIRIGELNIDCSTVIIILLIIILILIFIIISGIFWIQHILQDKHRRRR